MTSMLTSYEDFIARVEVLGFMALSRLLPGLPSLGDETSREAWHTGLETDPWGWKDRAAEEKRLAYGCILGGHKGFISRRMYPIFYAACHPAQSMTERWASGTISQETWLAWRLFVEHGRLNISQVRQSLHSADKAGTRAVDAAVEQLQREFYITVDGHERKVSSRGELYGWPVIRYCRVTDWASDGWLQGAPDWPRGEARDCILDESVAVSAGVSRQALAAKLGWC